MPDEAIFAPRNFVAPAQSLRLRVRKRQKGRENRRSDQDTSREHNRERAWAPQAMRRFRLGAAPSLAAARLWGKTVLSASQTTIKYHRHWLAGRSGEKNVKLQTHHASTPPPCGDTRQVLRRSGNEATTEAEPPLMFVTLCRAAWLHRKYVSSNWLFPHQQLTPSSPRSWFTLPRIRLQP